MDDARVPAPSVVVSALTVTGSLARVYATVRATTRRGGGNITNSYQWGLGHRPSLDALRGLTVLLVIGGHIAYPGLIHGMGKVGVGVFFALSGYLITGILVADHDQRGAVRLGRFYIRRARRLLPALIVFVGAMMAVRLAGIEQAAPALFYYANLTTEPLGVLAHTWSLAVEEQFYFVWPVLLILALRFRVMPMLLAVSAALLILVGWAWPGTLLGGAAVALVSRERGKDLRIPGWLAGLAIAALAGMCFVDSDAAFGLIAVSGPVLVGWVAANPARSWRPLERVGRIAYGIYLWHYPVALIVRLAGLPYLASLAIVMPVSIAFGVASWVVIERRFVEWGLRVRGPADRRAPARVGSGGAVEPHDAELHGVPHGRRVEGIIG